MDEAYASINWKTIFMMVGLIPLASDGLQWRGGVAGHTIDKLPAGIPIWTPELALALLTHRILAGHQPRRGDHRHRADRGQPGAGRRRQPPLRSR